MPFQNYQITSRMQNVQKCHNFILAWLEKDLVKVQKTWWYGGTRFVSDYLDIKLHSISIGSTVLPFPIYLSTLKDKAINSIASRRRQIQQLTNNNKLISQEHHLIPTPCFIPRKLRLNWILKNSLVWKVDDARNSSKSFSCCSLSHDITRQTPSKQVFPPLSHRAPSKHPIRHHAKTLPRKSKK